MVGVADRLGNRAELVVGASYEKGVTLSEHRLRRVKSSDAPEAPKLTFSMADDSARGLISEREYFGAIDRASKVVLPCLMDQIHNGSYLPTVCRASRLACAHRCGVV